MESCLEVVSADECLVRFEGTLFFLFIACFADWLALRELPLEVFLNDHDDDDDNDDHDEELGWNWLHSWMWCFS